MQSYYDNEKGCLLKYLSSTAETDVSCVVSMLINQKHTYLKIKYAKFLGLKKMIKSLS